MKTKFKFESVVNKTVTATPEKVIYNGTSGNIWTFYGYDELRGIDNIHLARTFMSDASTKKQIIEQFERM